MCFENPRACETYPDLLQLRLELLMVQTTLLVAIRVDVPKGGPKSFTAFVESQGVVSMFDVYF